MSRTTSSVCYNPAAPSAQTPAEDGSNRFVISAALFLRALAIVHFIAFLSFWIQLPGLVGPNGIAPAADFLSAVHVQLGSNAYLALPTLCWLFGTDTFPHVLCALGLIASGGLFMGVLPVASLALLWVSYLSIVAIGQMFLGFQWDILLLEATWLALFLAPRAACPRWRLHSPQPLARWLLVWLLFRLMFLSGIVKLTSGDPTWRSLTALTFHFETQPLPNPLAWWAHQLPTGINRATCALALFIELVVPFFLFGPRRLRHIGGGLLLTLQLAIGATGNFAFFNLLTASLALLAFDDKWWSTLPKVGHAIARKLSSAASALNPPRTSSALRVVTIAVVLYSVMLAVPVITPSSGLPALFRPFYQGVSPFYLVNNYGLFAVMTTERPELIFEGSNDGRTWLPYEFFHKPGDVSRRPTWVAPHQPRLDWQLWFAALAPPEQNPWVLSFCEHLLRGTPQVLAFVRSNPFPERPPLLLRVVRYNYHFTTFAERKRSGHWWRRTPRDIYLPPTSLQTPDIRGN